MPVPLINHHHNKAAKKSYIEIVAEVLKLFAATGYH